MLPDGSHQVFFFDFVKFYVIDFLLFVIEVLTYQNFGSYVLGVAFHPTKNLLASCSDDKTIKTWDITSGSCLSTLNVGYAFSRFSTRIFLPARPLFSRFSTRISV